MVLYRSRSLLSAIALLFIVVGAGSVRSQIEPSYARDDERLWIDFEAQGRLDPDPYASDYRGGDVFLKISGLIEPVEYDDSAMIGFDSWELPFTLSIEPCKVIDPSDGSVVSDSHCRRNGLGKIMINLRFNLETGLGELALHSADLANCVSGDPPLPHSPEIMYYIGSIEDRQIHPDPPLILTRADLETDFEKNWNWDMHYVGLCHFTNCPVIWTVNLTLSSKPPEKAKVTIDGCANIMIGVSAEMTATVEPETEGTYTWTSDPSDVFTISGSGKTATATGNKAGRATIRVEFQPKKGKKVEGKISGTVVELLSVNGGAEIPVIGLYDENAARKPSVQVPTVQDPPDGELLDFPVADDAIATVQNLGTSLVIQGIKEGVTSAQGKTGCGDQDEHIINIEVVNCDEETKQKLRDKLKEIRERLNEKTAELKEKLNDPSFQRAHKNLDRNLMKAFEKLMSIAGSCLGAVTSAASGTAGSWKDLDNFVDYLDAAFDATEKGTWEGDWSLWEMYKTMQISTFKKFTLGIAGDVFEYGEAWFAAQDALAEMKQIVQELKNLKRDADQIRDEYNEIDNRLMDLCKDYGGETGQPGKPEPKEPPSDEPPDDKPPETKEPPAPKPPEPKPPTDPTGEQPPGEPSDTPADDAPSDDKPGEEPPPPPPPPPPPQTPRGSGGIPLNCECDKLDRSSASEIELTQVSNSIEQLVNCFDQFMNGTIKPFQAVNDSGQQLFEEIEQALTLPQSKWGETFKGFLPRISGLKSEFTAFGVDIKNFSETSQGCSNAGQKLSDAMVLGAAVPELKQ